jgi:hypothetical protein
MTRFDEATRRIAEEAWRSVAAERRHLRRFGLTVGAAFGILALILLWRQRPAWPTFAGIASAFLLLAGVAPMILRPIERIWMQLATWMGWVMTRVILGLVFVLLFTPIGLAMRLLRKDPLHLRFDPRAGTYWTRREGHDPSPERMERMY